MNDANSENPLWAILYSHVMAIMAIWLLGGTIVLLGSFVIFEPTQSTSSSGPVSAFVTGFMGAVRMFGPFLVWMSVGVLLKTTIIAKHTGDPHRDVAASMAGGEHD